MSYLGKPMYLSLNIIHRPSPKSIIVATRIARLF